MLKIIMQRELTELSLPQRVKLTTPRPNAVKHQNPQSVALCEDELSTLFKPF